MAKNLVNGSNIEVIESENNISLDFTSGNSIDTKIGNLSNLNTPDKTSLVNAINSVVESGSNAIGRWK